MNYQKLKKNGGRPCPTPPAGAAIVNTKNKNRKNRKINFSFISEYCATIWTKKRRRLFLRGGGGRRDLHILN